MRINTAHSDPAGRSESGGATPPWLRKSLIALLIIAACGGFVSTGLTLWNSVKTVSSGIQLPAQPDKKQDGLEEWISRMEQTLPRTQRSAGGGITCQGMIAGDEGGALAVINGQTVAAGSRINGIRIIEITGSNVVVESEGGQTQILEPGDSFVPKR